SRPPQDGEQFPAESVGELVPRRAHAFFLVRKGNRFGYLTTAGASFAGGQARAPAGTGSPESATQFGSRGGLGLRLEILASPGVTPASGGESATPPRTRGSRRRCAPGTPP